MNEIEQQLRGLGKEEFESFVHQYLVAKYPGAEIKRVDGAGGDGGVDSFQGQLDTGPSIWQSKHFPNRIKQTQQQQILKSIKRAFKENAPSLWFLCLPINLRTPEHKWFQTRIVNAYGGPNRVKLIQASNFVTELQHNRRLRDAFFPLHALSKMQDIRKIVTLTEGRSQEQLGAAMTEYAQQYLDSSTDIEPRLKSIVTIGGDVQMRQMPPHQHGLVMSINEGERTTHLFARDPKSFNLDPIRFSVEMRPEDRMALGKAIETGQPFSLLPGNVLQIQSSSPLMNSFIQRSEPTAIRMDMTPQIPEQLAAKETPLRFVAGSGAFLKELRYVPFKITRAGTGEITLSSRGNLPIEITVILRFNSEEGASVNFSPILPGADVQVLDNVMQFLDTLERTGELEVISLEIEGVILKQEGREFKSSLGISPEIRRILSNAATVSKTFGKSLRVPERISENEVGDLSTLKLIATGENFSDVNIDAVLKKDLALQDRVLESLMQSSFSMKVDHSPDGTNFRIFGEDIEAGPITFIADEVSFIDAKGIRERYLAAEDGDGVAFKAHCPGPCRWVRKNNGLDPRAAILKDGGASICD
ncbi:hypothetical protein [Tunturiibacter gelidiferens]|uniref:Restriction endonuclease type IV Mrr domain-containing protein n=1 Tax=Tunturiibacter gelidiferens TaxID=3069689 RepID=A0AAU7Z6C7_9BACT